MYNKRSLHSVHVHINSSTKLIVLIVPDSLKIKNISKKTSRFHENIHYIYDVYALPKVDFYNNYEYTYML